MVDVRLHHEARPAASPLRLLAELEPWHRVFFRNLGDLILLREPRPLRITARPAPFWPDVFVSTELPRRGLAQSTLWHALLLVSIYALTRWMPAPAGQSRLFHNARITYYSVSDYLPPLDSGSEPAREAKKGEPLYARQRVISLPRNADNSRQTIVDPSSPRILREPRPLPNMIAWAAPAPAVPVTGMAYSHFSLPAPDLSVIAPAVRSVAREIAHLRTVAPLGEAVPPAVQPAERDLARLHVPKLSPGAVEPIASTDGVNRKLGDLNIGKITPTAAAPKITVAEQRSTGAAGTGGGQPAAPAAPSLGGALGARQAAGRLIALGLDPVPAKGPIEVPGGNRRGAFAAGPEGKPGAPGTPEIAGGGSGEAGNGHGDGAGAGGPADIPAGILVAGGLPSPLTAVVAAPAAPPPAPPPPSPVRSPVPKAFASLPPARLSDIARQTAPNRPQGTPLADEVFGPKRYYTMALNMPNLSSAAGTWIMRFAELNDSPDKSDLTAPEATVKVDPAYPAELIRQHIEGTVTLYAVIRADGTVGDVRVLRGVEERLDENAKSALARWHFRPATKRGAAVDLEAVVQIPFRTRRIQF